MKKIALSILTIIAISVSLLIFFVWYSPHFFIKHLLQGTIKDLQDSGVIISLVEPEPRKTAIHLSIPSLELRNILLEPQLVVSRWFPPSLDVGIEKNLSPLTLGGIDLKTVRIKLVLARLLSEVPQLDMALFAITEDAPTLSLDLQAQSRELTGDALSFDGTLKLSGKEFIVNGPFDFLWDLKRDLPIVNWKADNVAVSLYEKERIATVKLEVKTLSHPYIPKHLILDLQSLISIPKTGPIQISGNIKERSSDLNMALKGNCSSDLNKCGLSYKLPVRFSKTLQPPSLYPALKKNVLGWEGELHISGDVIKDKKSLRADMAVRTKQLSGFAYDTQILNLGMLANLTVYPQFKSKRPAQITVDKIGENLCLDSVKATFTVNPHSIDVATLTADLKGGGLSLKPARIPFPSFEGAYRLTLNNMDLSRFLLAMKSDRLSGEGKIDGSVPIRIKKGTLLIENALLTNRGPGKLRYQDESIRDVKDKIEYLADFNDLLARGQQALAYKALSDFHFSIFELRANRTSTEKLSVALHLKGKNPKLAKGQPFEINLPISGNLEPFLMESLLKSSMENEE